MSRRRSNESRIGTSHQSCIRCPNTAPRLRTCAFRSAHGVRPSTVQLPLVGVRMPVISLTSVLLPAPFGPISPTSSPRPMRKDTSLSACTSRVSRRHRRVMPPFSGFSRRMYVFVSPSVTMKGGFIPCCSMACLLWMRARQFFCRHQKSSAVLPRFSSRELDSAAHYFGRCRAFSHIGSVIISSGRCSVNIQSGKNHRISSYIMMAAAIAAFRLSAPPRMGRRTRCVAVCCTCSLTPLPSLPMTRANCSATFSRS